MRGSTGRWQNGELTKQQKWEMQQQQQQSIGRRSILSFSFFLFTGDSLAAVTTLPHTLPYKCCQLIVFADTDRHFHLTLSQICFPLLFLLSMLSPITGIAHHRWPPPPPQLLLCFACLFICLSFEIQPNGITAAVAFTLSHSLSLNLLCQIQRKTEETADFACLTQILFGRGSSTCWHGQSMVMVMVMVMEVAVVLVAIAC